MTRADIVQQVAADTSMTLKDAERMVNEIFISMVKALRGGDEIELRGFGSFRQRTRAARKGRNPKTGEAVAIPAKTVTYFKVGKELKAALLAGGVKA